MSQRLVFREKLKLNSHYGHKFPTSLPRWPLCVVCVELNVKYAISILINNVAHSRYLNVHSAFALRYRDSGSYLLGKVNTTLIYC